MKIAVAIASVLPLVPAAAQPLHPTRSYPAGPTPHAFHQPAAPRLPAASLRVFLESPSPAEFLTKETDLVFATASGREAGRIRLPPGEFCGSWGFDTGPDSILGVCSSTAPQSRGPQIVRFEASGARTVIGGFAVPRSAHPLSYALLRGRPIAVDSYGRILLPDDFGVLRPLPGSVEQPLSQYKLLVSATGHAVIVDKGYARVSFIDREGRQGEWRDIDDPELRYARSLLDNKTESLSTLSGWIAGMSIDDGGRLWGYLLPVSRKEGLTLICVRPDGGVRRVTVAVEPAEKRPMLPLLVDYSAGAVSLWWPGGMVDEYRLP